MFYYKHFDTGEPQCVSDSIEGFLKKVEKKFPKLRNKFQRLKTIKVVPDGIIVGILIQSVVDGTVTLDTSAVLVFRK